jgi:hypothetical protein
LGTRVPAEATSGASPSVALVLVLASAEAVAGITAGATIIAALIIALITARTTNHRQKQQLEHDREIGDLADLRGVLEEAALALYRAAELALTADGKLEDQLIVTMVSEKLSEGWHDLEPLRVRLGLRLGEGDPIVRTFNDAVDSLVVIGEQIGRKSAEPHWLENATGETLGAMRRTVSRPTRRSRLRPTTSSAAPSTAPAPIR